MFILGLLSLVQMLFLPGYILASFFPAETPLRKAINCFGLSLLANYFIVVLLNLIGAYTQTSMLFFFGIEVLLALIVYKKDRLYRFAQPPRQSFWLWLQEKPSCEKATWQFWMLISAFLSLICVALGSKALAGTIFDGWDPVFSWNRWAVEWSQGILPTGTFHYPQLLPANFSVSYAFLGTGKIDFFAHALMFFFPVAQFAAFWDLGVQKRSLYFFAALACCAFFNLVNNIHYFGMGLADIPVATFCFLAVSCLLYAQSSLDRQRNLWLGMLYLTAACLTKQMGFLFLLMYPILAYQLAPPFPRNAPQSRKFCLSLLATAAVLILPWYIYKETQIWNGSEQSEIGYLLTTIHENRTPWERLEFALTNLFRKPTLARILHLSPAASLTLFWGMLLSAAFLFLLSFKDAAMRWIGLLLSGPAFLIWALVYNYDSRNLAAALPVMALNTGYGILELPAVLDGILIGLVGALKTVIRLFSVSYTWIILGAAAIVLNTMWSKEQMIDSHDRQTLSLGNARVNQRLYRYHADAGIEGGILTHYPHLTVLPPFKGLYRGCNMANLDEFQKGCASYTDIRYWLVPPWPEPGKGLHGQVPALIQKGELTLIFEEDGFYFLKLNNFNAETQRAQRNAESPFNHDAHSN